MTGGWMSEIFENNSSELSFCGCGLWAYNSSQTKWSAEMFLFQNLKLPSVSASIGRKISVFFQIDPQVGLFP